MFQIYKLQVIIQTIKFQIIKLSTKERAIEEKVRLADLQAEATFYRRKDMQSCKLNRYGLKKKWQKHNPELRSMKKRT